VVSTSGRDTDVQRTSRQRRHDIPETARQAHGRHRRADCATWVRRVRNAARTTVAADGAAASTAPSLDVIPAEEGHMDDDTGPALPDLGPALTAALRASPDRTPEPGRRTTGWLGPGAPVAQGSAGLELDEWAADGAPGESGWDGELVLPWGDADEWTDEALDPVWPGFEPGTGPDPAASPDGSTEDAASWLAHAGVDGDESEILPALAAIIPAVVSAAPAIISAVQQLTSRPQPAPAPPPPPAPRPAPRPPAAPPAAAAPRPATPRPPVRVVVPPRAAPGGVATTPSASVLTGGAPSGGSTAGGDGSAGAAVAVDVLRQLADVLPRLVTLVEGLSRERVVEAAHLGTGHGGRTAGAGGSGERGSGEGGSGEGAGGTSPAPVERGGEAEDDPSHESATGRGPPRDLPTGRSSRAAAVVAGRPAATDLVPLPDRAALNVGVSPCPTSLLVTRFGAPRELVTAECRAITSPFWSSRMVTGQVGTFQVRGHRRAVELFRDAFAALETADPELHALIGSTGMLCVRHVRGRPDVLSNHALGLAVDVTLDGAVDIRGDDTVQHGLVALHDALSPFGIFWGASLRPEDAIHFEVGAEVIHRWLDEGTF
jgi:hypothetical protein